MSPSLIQRTCFQFLFDRFWWFLGTIVFPKYVFQRDKQMLCEITGIEGGGVGRDVSDIVYEIGCQSIKRRRGLNKQQHFSLAAS